MNIDDLPELCIILGFYALFIRSMIDYYKRDKDRSHKISEYVLPLLACVVGALIAYQYYTDLLPITLWSLVSGAIIAFILEIQRRRNLKS